MRGRRISLARVGRVAVSVALVVVLVVGVSVPGYGSEGGVVPVEDGGVHQPAIDALRRHVVGVFDGTGCGEGGLCAGEPLLRWEMAVWLVRVLDGANPTGEAASRFADVEDDVWWAPYTDRLAELGVTSGCATGPLRFCPIRAVTRAQMATFLVGAFDLEAAGSGVFVDTTGNTHEAAIDALAAAGITAGCATGPLRFCPGRSVTRGQMATFLARALGLLPTQAPSTRPPASPFSDVPSDHPDARSVTRLRNVGVLDGTECGENRDRFCPDQAVDRKTFAVWLVRALDGTDAPDFGDGSAIPASGRVARFVDVPESFREHGFVERLAGLGVVSGCGSDPSRFCPDGTIPRDLMATWLDRAFGFPKVDMLGFVDVDEDDPNSASINEAWASRVIEECNPNQNGPLIFCPDQQVSRAQAITMLDRAIDWKQANDLIALTTNEPDDSVSLSVTYDEESYQARVAWTIRTEKINQVDRYIVQWREPWRAFDADSHVMVEAVADKSHYSTTLTNLFYNDLYAVRVITVYEDGDVLATEESKVPKYSHQLRDLIEQKIINPHQDGQPWLKDTWRYVNSPRFVINVSKNNSTGVSLSSAGRTNPNKIVLTVAITLHLSPKFIEQFDRYKDTIIHELGHVYTLTNSISSSGGIPTAIGHLYLEQLYLDRSGSAENANRCSPTELYADLAVLAFFDPSTSSFHPYHGTQGVADFGLLYWSGCKFNMNRQEQRDVSRIVSDITRSVFIEQDMPDWFEATYLEPDGAIDFEGLWSAIHEREGFYIETRGLIAHDLRGKLGDYDFGDYCDERKVRQLLDGRISRLRNHWSKAGCSKDEPENEVTRQNQTPSSTTSTAEEGAGEPQPQQQLLYGYTLESLKSSSARSTKCWVAIEELVYDVTPGNGAYPREEDLGSIFDQGLCGEDATEHFRTNNIPLPPEQYVRGRLIP